MIRPIHLPRHQ
ncbi:hypothetical protein D047_4156A, partial [Vibrio parahaemolyticus VPTS-2010_2]